MEGWRQQTITKHPDTRGSFASGIRPQHRPWGAPHCSLGICFPIAPLINRGQLQHRPWGAPHRSLGISFISAPCVQEKRPVSGKGCATPSPQKVYRKPSNKCGQFAPGLRAHYSHPLGSSSSLPGDFRLSSGYHVPGGGVGARCGCCRECIVPGVAAVESA